MKYVITIPEPCNENRNAMTPTEKGMFCSNCKKEVFDFTQKNSYQLFGVLNSDTSICGRFRPGQLDTAFRFAHDNRTYERSTFWSRPATHFGNASDCPNRKTYCRNPYVRFPNGWPMYSERRKTRPANKSLPGVKGYT